jgi:hypothetical protein
MLYRVCLCRHADLSSTDLYVHSARYTSAASWTATHPRAPTTMLCSIASETSRDLEKKHLVLRGLLELVRDEHDDHRYRSVWSLRP